jgi:hypothetical protein
MPFCSALTEPVSPVGARRGVDAQPNLAAGAGQGEQVPDIITESRDRGRVGQRETQLAGVGLHLGVEPVLAGLRPHPERAPSGRRNAHSRAWLALVAVVA